ncbi:MAG: epoxyqueuosine reductase QueH [Saccharofermentanales bacterium]
MKLLLHTCCAPCLIYPLKEIRKEQTDVNLFYYNPNIHPITEYIRRRDTLLDYAKNNSLNVILSDSDETMFVNERAAAENLWKNYDVDGRCAMCYRTRFEKTAEYAAKNGYDAFSTTLLVSIYQNHELIIRICEDLSRTYNIGFYYKDFRPGFREGQKEARDIGLYRQKYCGCICSLKESAAITQPGI